MAHRTRFDVAPDGRHIVIEALESVEADIAIIETSGKVAVTRQILPFEIETTTAGANERAAGLRRVRLAIPWPVSRHVAASPSSAPWSRASRR